MTKVSVESEELSRNALFKELDVGLEELGYRKGVPNRGLRYQPRQAGNRIPVAFFRAAERVIASVSPEYYLSTGSVRDVAADAFQLSMLRRTSRRDRGVAEP